MRSLVVRRGCDSAGMARPCDLLAPTVIQYYVQRSVAFPSGRTGTPGSTPYLDCQSHSLGLYSHSSRPKLLRRLPRHGSATIGPCQASQIAVSCNVRGTNIMSIYYVQESLWIIAILGLALILISIRSSAISPFIETSRSPVMPCVALVPTRSRGVAGSRS